jgi:hypothetical protein
VLATVVGCGSSDDGPPEPAACSGDALITSSSELSAFSARRCSSVTGSLDIRETSGSGKIDVQTVNLPLLTALGGDLRVWSNYGLLALRLPALTSVGGELDVDDNPHLTSLDLPVLATVGGLSIALSDDLISFSLPALTAVEGALDVGSNAALTSFALASLSTLGGPLYVQGNTSLPECQALAFKDHLVTAHGFTGSWFISGNDTAATCP